MSLYEIFPDSAYCDMWCVRPIGVSEFGDGFHVASEDEAKALRVQLSNRRTHEDEEAALVAGHRLGLQAASAMLCLTEQEIRLACGEMTAQEMRTVNAVLEWRRAAIVRKAEELEGQGAG